MLECSRLPLRMWAIAIYLFVTSLKGVSSMKLHRDLEITQKSAWFMLHRIRKAFEMMDSLPPLSGPVEVDETYIGGKRKNMSLSKRRKLKGRGSVGKAAVVGILDRSTNQVRVQPVENTDKETLQGIIVENVEPGATVYTDDARAYCGLPFPHESVKHSAGEYVREMAHTNGIESFWAVLKRAHMGTYHQFSFKHLLRYANEFAGRHNVRNADTLDQMHDVVAGLVGKRLMYRDLIK